MAAKLWEPPAAETGLAVGAKPVPSKEERARNVRLGAARTGGLGAPGAAAGARYGGGVGTAAFLRGAEGRRVGAPARGAGVERSGMLAWSVCHRVRRAGACLLDKHGSTNAKSQDTRKRAAVGRLRQENRLLEGAAAVGGDLGHRKNPRRGRPWSPLAAMEGYPGREGRPRSAPTGSFQAFGRVVEGGGRGCRKGRRSL